MISAAPGGTPVPRVYEYTRVYERTGPGTNDPMPEQLTTPRELLAAYLRQMLWIERQLADELLPRLREQAHSPELRHGFDRHDDRHQLQRQLQQQQRR